MDKYLTVTLPGRVFSALERTSKRLAKTPESIAAEIIQASLKSGDVQPISAEAYELVLMRRQIQELRRDMAIGIETMLIAGAKMNQEEARKWVDERIPSRSSGVGL